MKNKFVLEIANGNEECSWVNYYKFLADDKDEVILGIMSALDKVVGWYNNPYLECPASEVTVLGTSFPWHDLIYQDRIERAGTKNPKVFWSYVDPVILTLDEWFDRL